MRNVLAGSITPTYEILNRFCIHIKADYGLPCSRILMKGLRGTRLRVFDYVLDRFFQSLSYSTTACRLCVVFAGIKV